MGWFVVRVILCWKRCHKLMWEYNHATVLKTNRLYEWSTDVCACGELFSMATTEEGCPVKGGIRIREGWVCLSVCLSVCLPTYLSIYHLSIKSPFETYISRQRFTSSAETEKYWHLRRHRYRITPHQISPIPPLRSRFFTGDDDLECALYSTVCNVNFATYAYTTQSRCDIVPCYVHDITCRSARSWDWGQSALH